MKALIPFVLAVALILAPRPAHAGLASAAEIAAAIEGASKIIAEARKTLEDIANLPLEAQAGYCRLVGFKEKTEGIKSYTAKMEQLTSTELSQTCAGLSQEDVQELKNNAAQLVRDLQASGLNRAICRGDLAAFKSAVAVLKAQLIALEAAVRQVVASNRCSTPQPNASLASN
jgi:hypothetical protein